MNPRIQAYIDLVESGKTPMCREQLLLIKRVKAAFQNEKIHVDAEQLERYMGLQKYFEYKLLPWEEFVFALHNCTYTESGALRWPILFIEVGRGAGKNGYLAFEDFALTTPINGVKIFSPRPKTRPAQPLTTYTNCWTETSPIFRNSSHGQKKKLSTRRP